MNELYWSEDRVALLKARKKRCVCRHCGGPLEIKRILFNDVADARVELYCERCERIEFGVEPEVYRAAYHFVGHLAEDFYEEMDDNETKHRMNVARVCDILSWGLRHLGLLDDEGFTVQTAPKEGDWQECLVLESGALASLLAGASGGGEQDDC